MRSSKAFPEYNTHPYGMQGVNACSCFANHAAGEAMVGMSIFSLLEDAAAAEAFNEKCKASSPEDFAEHRVSAKSLERQGVCLCARACMPLCVKHT